MEHQRDIGPAEPEVVDEPGQLIAEIQAYCEARGIEPSTLGKNAIGDRDLIDRLMRYRERTRDVAARLRAYMRKNPPKRQAS
jgi:hypothetical protein